jgi:hypothetical protein
MESYNYELGEKYGCIDKNHRSWVNLDIDDNPWNPNSEIPIHIVIKP